MYILEDIEDLYDANTFIEPPNPDELVDNLSGRQFRAHAEIEFRNGTRIGDSSVSYQSTSNVPLVNQKFKFLTIE